MNEKQVLELMRDVVVAAFDRERGTALSVLSVEIDRRLAALPADAHETPDPTRCFVCGWPLAASREKGCVAGDCSYRPVEGTDEWHRIKCRRDSLQNKESVGLHAAPMQQASVPALAPDEAHAETPQGVARSGHSRGITDHQGAAPSIDECVHAFVLGRSREAMRVRETCYGVQMSDGSARTMSTHDHAGIAAVRSLCLRSPPAPAIDVEQVVRAACAVLPNRDYSLVTEKVAEAIRAALGGKETK